MVRFLVVVLLTLVGGFMGALLGMLLFGEGNLFYGCIILGAISGGLWGMTIKRPIALIADFIANLFLR